MTEISVLQPLERAWDRMMQVCFRPFDAAKWFTLGFCAWLAVLATGGGSFNSSGSRNSGGNNGAARALDFINRWLQWCADHALLVIVGLAVVFVIALCVSALILWLRSRGDFMFIDGIARNRGAVVEPWRTFKPLGNDLFVIRMALWVVMTGWIFCMLLLGVFSTWPALFGHLASLGNDVSWNNLVPGEILLTLVLLGAVTAALIVTLSLANAVIDNLVLPVMYARDATVGQAWRAIREEMLPGNVGSLALFYLTLIVVGLGLGVLGFILTVLTCCFAALPYVGTVILLPLAVFKRSYVLYFVEQFGFEIFRFDPAGAEPGPSRSARV